MSPRLTEGSQLPHLRQRGFRPPVRVTCSQGLRQAEWLVIANRFLPRAKPYGCMVKQPWPADPLLAPNNLRKRFNRL